ncbi:MAG TPA: DUF1697 domain-containing protein [Steroidobacteraceae bacterium]|nr:DUF1697 domain-containing protein [Steroidobacteraceae bacterium]
MGRTATLRATSATRGRRPSTAASAAHTWIALLRGINVVGKNKVPMKDLAAAFERAGFRAVRTYIQSGNVIFQSAGGTARPLGTRIAQLMRKEFGFAPQVMVISGEELTRAVRGNPFPGAHQDHKSLHLFFLSERPTKPDLDSLAKLDAGREAFALKGAVFYLYTPDGFPDSVLRPRIERCLGVHATGRNWRTANELLKMLD